MGHRDPVPVYLLGGTSRYTKPVLHVGAATVKSTVCAGFEIGLEELLSAIPACYGSCWLISP
jgi:hypothetical protein